MDWKNPKLIATLLVLIFGVFLVAEIGKQQAAPASALPDDPNSPFHLLAPDKQILMPELTLKTPEGAPFKLSEAVKKGPVVLDFWATYCGPCRMELPDLDAIRKQYEPKGLQFYAVNSSDDPATIRAYATDNKLGIGMLVDQPPDAARTLGISSIPVTVIVDKHQKAVCVLVGYDPSMSTDLPATLDKVVENNR